MLPSLLAVTSEPPWPLNTGGHLRTHHLLRVLASRFRVRLVTGSTKPLQLTELATHGVVSTVVKLPKRTLMTDAGGVFAAALRSRPYVMYDRHDWRAVRGAVCDAIAVEAPDVFYMDHLDSFVYADLVPVRTCLALDLHNVYSLLACRTAQESTGLRRAYLSREGRLLADMERRCAARVDSLTAVSEAEADYFRQLGARSVHVVPNGVEFCRYKDLPEGRDGGTPTMLFVGAMSWRPNVAAARFLAETVLPDVRDALPSAELRIVGRDPLPEVTALSRLPGVIVTGSVDSVLPHLRDAHLLAVPLEAGGGTRLKILEAFAAGLPVVSTAIGAEGIEAEDGKHFLRAERSEFAAAIVRILQDKALGRTLAKAARRLALEKYDWNTVGRKAFSALLDGVRSHAESARHQ